MAGVTIAIEPFFSRLTRLYELWTKEDVEEGEYEVLRSCESLVVVAGDNDEERPYRKGTALQTWLMGYEFPSTGLAFNKQTLTFIGSTNKCKFFQPLITASAKDKELNPLGIKLQVIEKAAAKDDEAKKKEKEKMVSFLGQLSEPVGHISKDKYDGKIVKEYEAALNESGMDKDKFLDVGSAIAALLAKKDKLELGNVQSASEMSLHLMSLFQRELVACIEEDKKLTHEKLGEIVEKRLDSTGAWKGFKSHTTSFDPQYGDWCYSPIIQSGGDYDLKASASSNDKRLKSTGVILCNMGIRYRSYCSNVGRTFIIDPHKEQDERYAFLKQLQLFAISQLKHGSVAKDVHAAIMEKLREEKPELEEYVFGKSFGHVIGIEFRESTFSLSSKCTKVLQEGQVWSVGVGFQGMTDPNNKNLTYAMSLTDTVLVQKDSGKSLSPGMKEKADVVFYLNADDPKSKQKKPAAVARTRGGGDKSSAVMATKLRAEAREVDHEMSNKRKMHQKELAQKIQEEGVERYGSGQGTGAKEKKEKKWKRFESYARESLIPDSVKDLRVIVDHKRHSIVIPINGFAVPFHINTLKSAIKQEEGEYTVMRLMFVTPGQITGKKEDTPFENPNATFLRGMTLRSTDNYRFSELHKEIQEMKRTATKRENERKEMEDVVEQGDLIERKDRKPVRLQDIQVRPAFDAKRQAGDVEIHKNGIRYQSSIRSDHRIDLLFSNIKHLFFQPCDHELMSIVHVHLKNPILMGKKKTRDVQFFREASEAAFDETGNRKRRRQFHDEDELEAEQEEKKRRAELNKYFKAFADKVAEASDNRFEVDIPFRDLGFTGVPFRQNCLLQPTTDCLVHLTEPPFLVITLNEIEIAHLERVQYGLKNFDLCFVFKDYTKPVVHINTIPMNQLENVKEWLDSVDISFTEGQVNLNWPTIMKTVNDGPAEFFEEGGWGFCLRIRDGRIRLPNGILRRLV
ncbi:SPT16-domain-containing protein [Atractiella rhizophila]|nr:SPT16-domain-containing protein [Atractiella rhizophila]